MPSPNPVVTISTRVGPQPGSRLGGPVPFSRSSCIFRVHGTIKLKAGKPKLGQSLTAMSVESEATPTISDNGGVF